MGRAERIRRQAMRRQECWEASRLAAAEAPAVEEVESPEDFEEPEDSGSLEGMEFDENDDLRTGDGDENGGAWKAAQLGTSDQVALLFQVHRKTVERWRRKAGLPHVRVCGVIRYDLEEVKRWARERTEGRGGAVVQEVPAACENVPGATSEGGSHELR